MILRIKTINVDEGDCIGVFIKNNDERQFNILIDCGLKYGDKELSIVIRNFVEKDFQKHINLLIVSHIDKDHTEGLCKILEEYSDIVIEHIWFNCFQGQADTPVKTLPEKHFKRLKELCNKIPNYGSVVHEIGKEEAKILSKKILKNPNWSKGWNKEIIFNSHNEISLKDTEDNQFATVQILSPQFDYWEKYKQKYIDIFCELLDVDDIDFYNEDSIIYEILMKYKIQFHKDEIDIEAISAKTEDDLSELGIKRLALQKDQKDPSETNGVSLAFILELENSHKFLFLGDSHADIIQEKIAQIYKDENKPVIFDGIKVSHHGSRYNTSSELLKLVDSEYWFFTGSNEKRPHIQTIAKIVNRKIPVDTNSNPYFKTRKLYFNSNNDTIERLIYTQELQKCFNFEVFAHDKKNSKPSHNTDEETNEHTFKY